MEKKIRERNGCWTCRSRKKKCDTRRPTCRNCEARGIECKGYGLQLVWEDELRRHGMRRRGPRKWRKGSPSKKLQLGITLDNESQFSSVALATGVAMDREPSQAQSRDRVTGLRDQSTEPLVATVMAIYQCSTRLPPSVSSFPFELSPVQFLLLRHYLSCFVPTYFSCRNPGMPFLSMIIPLAMANSTVMSALLALIGLQAGRRGSPEIKVATLQAKQATLHGCKKLLEPFTGDASQPISMSNCSGIHESDAPKNQASNVNSENLLMLLASALLLLLYEQVTDASYSTIQPHLKFVHWLIETLEYQTGHNSRHRRNSTVPRPIAPYYSFLRSMFLYDDLIASISARRPPLAGYHKYIPRMQNTTPFDEDPKHYLPTILSRICSGDDTVGIEDIDRWDGQMGWLPSFFIPGEDSNAHESSKVHDQETYLISEIYRATSKVFYYQMLCMRPRQVKSYPGPSFCSTHEARCDEHVRLSFHTEVSALTLETISMLRDLPDESQYQTAILWPIGIVAQELGSDDLATQVSLLDQLGKLEHRYGMKHFTRYRNNLAATWARKRCNNLGGHSMASGECMLAETMDEAILLG